MGDLSQWVSEILALRKTLGRLSDATDRTGRDLWEEAVFKRVRVARHMCRISSSATDNSQWRGSRM